VGMRLVAGTGCEVLRQGIVVGRIVFLLVRWMGILDALVSLTLAVADHRVLLVGSGHVRSRRVQAHRIAGCSFGRRLAVHIPGVVAVGGIVDRPDHGPVGRSFADHGLLVDHNPDFGVGIAGSLGYIDRRGPTL
jgi:hypothetical protein